MTRQREDLPDPAGKSVVFEFEGPVVSVYATLAVRLSHSGVFNRAEMWKNAATYSTQPTGTCGMVLREPDEGRGELCLFFDERTKEDTRLQFEEYVRTHLERRALQETVRRRRVYICSGCQTPVTDLQARRRKERGLNWMECSVCGNRISLLDRDDRRADRPVVTVAQMDQAANAQRDRAASGARLRGKILTRDFDVFLCYNNQDKTAVMEIGGQLKERGILPWLDVWELRPGLPWQMELEDQIERIKCAAVFVGAEGLGPWQQQELMAFLRQFVNTGRPVIPVMLGKFSQAPKLPVFLETMTWVDFTQTQPDPLEHLMYGITGERRHAGPLGARAAGN
jgi:DNA-directed RNA polymerase subunit RPC12/RpoP